ncbi:hypothetical protein F0P96_04070 [Hymenobacter busanensis]|uniref:Copper-binding protein MbnP-like domain-containing protein n=1 Tax=Hymenobacter busanensis TaxID=2607656 RepID=A0A7L4ZUE6_9BACT|nr:MbnP family protein [Hymenobacter busanensis]KAA9339801.1 hypothetical protein F0P96_04070 [Hymenobacter busanensis]QHJ06445.1 hypothetical protein GUY19_03675 [Hymenobacter busanensis]
MNLLRRTAFLIAAASLTTLVGCDDNKDDPKPKTGELELHVENVAGTASLALNAGSYTTAQGETFSVTTLKYYLSGFKLNRADGTSWAEPDSYHLLDQRVAASQHIELKDIPAGDYTSLTFTIGVDSATSVGGVRTGALDVANNDMYWEWEGYTYLRLNGKSAKAAGGEFFFDVMGYRRPYNNLRTVTLRLPASTSAIHIGEGKTPEAHVKADILKVFSGASAIWLTQTSFVSGGADGKRLADNYANMFSIDHVHGN